MSEPGDSDHMNKRIKPLLPFSPSDRQQAVTVVMYIGLVGGFFALLANVWLLIQEGAWQMLVVPVGIVVAWLFLILANRQARLGNINRAGILTLIGVMVGLGIGELVHAGLTYYLGISGIVGILTAGLMILPSHWWLWVGMAGIYALYFWLVNTFQPLARYNVAEVVTFQGAVIIIVLSMVGLILWQLFRIMRYGTIRTRLLVTFVILVLLPGVSVGAVSSLVNARNAQQQVLQQLDLVVDLKQTEVQDWADNLSAYLLLALPADDQISMTQMVLAGMPSAPDEDYQAAYLHELSRFNQIIEYSQGFTALYLLDTNGVVQISTDQAQIGSNEAGYPYFNHALEGTFLSAEYLSPLTGQRVVTIATPVVDANGVRMGVLAGQVELSRLDEMMSQQSGLGSTGEIYIVGGRDQRLLTASRYEGYIAGETFPLNSEGIQQALSESSVAGMYVNYAGDQVFGAYRYLEELDMILIAERGQGEALSVVTRAVMTNLVVTAAVALLAFIVGVFITNRITTPIVNLARTAEQIAAGDLRLEAPVMQEDEVGALSRSFNLMTSRLRQSLTDLEQQIGERTAALGLRSAYLQAAVEVSRAVTSVLDPDILIQQVVDLIRERFNLYYVGLFTLDDTGDWAVLRAGTGEAGRTMLARNHRIKVGSGMIGWSVANQQPRIALRAELDETRLQNPILPKTRSEAAIPFRSRGRVIGAITIQSDQPDAFDEATVAVFETIADQIGVALDNARLFAESQEAYESLSRAYGEQTLQGWVKLLQANPTLGYRCDADGVVFREADWLPEMEVVYARGDVVTGSLADGILSTEAAPQETGESFIGVPIRVRDHIIGVINGYKPARGGRWQDDEIAFLRDVANMVGITLENARLYEDTQRRAEGERITAEVSARIRESLDVDTVMQAAVVELQRVLALKDVTIRLGDTHEQSST